jgi:hypothetical protein
VQFHAFASEYRRDMHAALTRPVEHVVEGLEVEKFSMPQLSEGTDKLPPTVRW